MRQNLLCIFTDRWRYQVIGCHYEDQVVTLSMDRFAAESMGFTHAYSTLPLCSPHQVSLTTGKYPFNVGMWTNHKIGLEEKIILKPQETCIGNVLKDNGYQTDYVGKWHLDTSELNFIPHPESGAVEWDAYAPSGERRQGFDYWLSYGACDEHLDPHYWTDSIKQIKSGKWSAEYETDRAIEYMESRKDDEAPSALFLSYNPPHLLCELVPDKHYDKSRDLDTDYRQNVSDGMKEGILGTQLRQYFAAVHGIDEQFGRIYNYLKENDLEENTLVVLSVNHGEMLGSHHLMSKNVWYEESIHIPLFMCQKGRIEAGENSVIFASPDHMPTLLDLLDIPVPETCQEYDHLKGMFGQDDKAPQDMFLCSYPGSAELVSIFSRQGLTYKACGWCGIKGDGYTYAVSNGYMPEEERTEYLYDDENDGYQMHPCQIPKDCTESEILGLRRRLREYLDMTGGPFLWDVRDEERE